MVALILLLVITLVGLAAVSGTLLQQKMSANFYDRQLAFQADEAALRAAEGAIRTATASASAPAGFLDCRSTSGNVCLANPFSDTNVPATSITSVPTATFNGGSIMGGSQPQYVIQYMGKFAIPNPKVKSLSCGGYGGAACIPTTADFYRITARSGDPAVIGNRAFVVLQSFFRR